MLPTGASNSSNGGRQQENVDASSDSGAAAGIGRSSFEPTSFADLYFAIQQDLDQEAKILLLEWLRIIDRVQRADGNIISANPLQRIASSDTQGLTVLRREIRQCLRAEVQRRVSAPTANLGGILHRSDLAVRVCRRQGLALAELIRDSGEDIRRCGARRLLQMTIWMVIDYHQMLADAARVARSRMQTEQAAEAFLGNPPLPAPPDVALAERVRAVEYEDPASESRGRGLFRNPFQARRQESPPNPFAASLGRRLSVVENIYSAEPTASSAPAQPSTQPLVQAPQMRLTHNQLMDAKYIRRHARQIQSVLRDDFSQNIEENYQRLVRQTEFLYLKQSSNSHKK